MKEFTDTERLDRIAEILDNERWSDVLPMFRPYDRDGSTEKYVSKATFREAIDYCMTNGLNIY